MAEEVGGEATVEGVVLVSKNSMGWWSEYVPYDDGNMVLVGSDFNCLQEKLKRGNIKICEACNKRHNSGKPLFFTAGHLMNCPIPHI